MTKKIKPIEHKFVNQSNQDEHTMVISGAIGESGWFYDAVSADDVRNALDGVTAPTIRIKLNSGGGDAMHGIEIYNYLKDLDKKVIVEVTANASSAASVVAMGADEIIMRTGSTMMIHEASTFAYGNKDGLQKSINALEAIDGSLVGIYQQKTGLPKEEIETMLREETWFTPEQALEKGFADSIEVVEEPEPEPIANNEWMEKITAQLNNLNGVVAQLNKNKNDEPKPEKAKNKGFIF